MHFAKNVIKSEKGEILKKFLHLHILWENSVYFSNKWIFSKNVIKSKKAPSPTSSVGKYRRLCFLKNGFLRKMISDPQRVKFLKRLLLHLLWENTVYYFAKKWIFAINVIRTEKGQIFKKVPHLYFQ